MAIFAFDLLIAGIGKQFLEATAAFTTCGIPCTHNGLLAKVYLKRFTCNANCYAIEMITASAHMRCHMKPYESLRLMVKTEEI